MASVGVLSATRAHAEEATHTPINKAEETTKDELTVPPPPSPPPTSEQKQTDSETEQSVDVTQEPETLAIAIEKKAVLTDEPIPKKKVAGASPKVAPEPFKEKTEETGKATSEQVEGALGEESVAEPKKEQEGKAFEEEDKVSPQAEVEKKED